MLRIDFFEALTTRELAQEVDDICNEVVAVDGLQAVVQPKQQTVYSGQVKSDTSPKEIVGNWHHEDWRISFQDEGRVIGALAIRGPVAPENYLFGGFDRGWWRLDLGRGGSVGFEPRYHHATFHTPGELGLEEELDPPPELVDLTYKALEDHFVTSFPPRLFDIADMWTPPRYPYVDTWNPPSVDSGEDMRTLAVHSAKITAT